jgi:NAD(P)H-dependent FMN reductase
VGNKGSIRVLAISGSLRRSSSNTALVGAAAQLVPDAVDVSICRELAELPHFNPDLDGDRAPATVTRFRAQLQACDAVLISSPEYAHGVPGVLKNALDWVVGSGELIDKPIAVINASARATHAWTSLRDTLTVMWARVIVPASITIPLDGKALDVDGIVRMAGRDSEVPLNVSIRLLATGFCIRIAANPTNSTRHAPSSAIARPSSNAKRVFPTPPGPMSVMRRAAGSVSKSCSAFTSVSRPRRAVRGRGNETRLNLSTAVR